MPKYITHILCFFCTFLLIAPERVSPQPDIKSILKRGMRVKIEGNARGERLYEADEVEMKGDASPAFSVEGIIEDIDLSHKNISISGVSLIVGPDVKVIDAEGEISSIPNLEIGKRVNATFAYDNERIQAKRIKLIDSDDQDIEIKALVENLIVYERTRMEITVLNMRFLCDEGTVFYYPEDTKVEFDFTELDPYYRLVDNDDERPASRLGIGDFISLGGEFQIDLIPENNFDLSDETDSDVVFTKLSTRLELSSKPHPDLDIFLKLVAQEPVSSDDPFHPDRSEGSVRLAEGYFLWRELFTDHLGIKVGRQDFDEKREWLFDENLDAVRLFLNFDPMLVEISTSTNFSETKVQDEGVINHILYGSYRIGTRRHVAAYVIHREDDDPIFNHDRRWYGVRSFGKFGKYIKYWMEVSFLRGERRGRELKSNGFDIGFTTTQEDLSMEPSFTLGYAYGSGDIDFKDMIDGNFRQTDFEDNNDKFNGVSSFKYYGEVLDPELSNLRIITTGMGFRWSKNGSFDILYHIYRQVYAYDKIHGSDLLADPTGASKAVGDEIDFILGLEKIKNVDIELTVGFFRPGEAFNPNTNIASNAKLQIEYNF
jgi:alginate production protein